MKRWMRWATRLYPAAWRARYGDEFAALLEDLSPRLRDLLDIVKEALKLDWVAWSFPKTVAAVGLVGMLLGAVVSYWTPVQYVSSTVLKIPGGTRTAVATALTEVLSRASLGQIIQKQDLYKRERRSQPLEDVIETMRHDISVDIVAPSVVRPFGVRLRFGYRDPRWRSARTGK
jgi:hypothetical protein